MDRAVVGFETVVDHIIDYSGHDFVMRRPMRENWTEEYGTRVAGTKPEACERPPSGLEPLSIVISQLLSGSLPGDEQRQSAVYVLPEAEYWPETGVP